MALPLIPFAAGLAIGGLVTYLLKDERVHRWVVEGARRASGLGPEGLDFRRAADREQAGGQAPPGPAAEDAREASPAGGTARGDREEPGSGVAAPDPSLGQLRER